MPPAPIMLNWTPALAAAPPVSKRRTWGSVGTSTSSPGRVIVLSATWFAIVPLGRNSAACMPKRSATSSWSLLTDGSSPYWSSPTSASAMARRIPWVGRVTVSDRRSMRSGMAPWDRPVSGHWEGGARPARSRSWHHRRHGLGAGRDRRRLAADPIQRGLEVLDAERLGQHRDVRAPDDLHRQRRQQHPGADEDPGQGEDRAATAGGKLHEVRSVDHEGI